MAKVKIVVNELDKEICHLYGRFDKRGFLYLASERVESLRDIFGWEIENEVIVSAPDPVYVGWRKRDIEKYERYKNDVRENRQLKNKKGEIMRYQIKEGSLSGHCCFEYSIVDSERYEYLNGNLYYENFCEVFDKADAKFICNALNAYLESGSSSVEEKAGGENE